MRGFQTREARIFGRELLFLVLSAAGAWLFLNHEFLRGVNPPPYDFSQYVVSTVVIYLFLRVIVLVADMRVPRVHAELVRCPECGQWLDDPTAEGRERHNRIELTPKPSEKEIVSAVALRKAVDAARVVAEAPRASRREDASTPGAIENLTSEELIAALDDPDLLERLLHSPGAPKGPRLKR